jgi:antitoxin component YwqK of YwqJK toxin-antitoxin module
MSNINKKKLFIPRKLSGENSRWSDWNKVQPIIDGVQINQYDMEGRKQGYWGIYYNNDQLWSKGSYKDDKEEGIWEYYYSNGLLRSKGLYKNGKQDGIWEDYSKYGNLEFRRLYKNGKLELKRNCKMKRN